MIRLMTERIAVASLSVLLFAMAPVRSASRVQAGVSAPPPRQMLWVSCDDVAHMTDSTLDAWHALGIGGFDCETGWLDGFGGSHAFTGDPTNPLTAPRYSLQNALRDRNVIRRIHGRGMKIYLVAYLANYDNPSTPLADWFDDAGWRRATKALGNLAGGAHLLGADGITFDGEMYPGRGGKATWSWRYRGNTHTEARVRAQATLRGQQAMTAILANFPGVAIDDYDADFPETWNSYVQKVVNQVADADRDSVQINWWDGMTRVDGYSAIHFFDAAFFKGPNLPGRDTDARWESSLAYDQNGWFALLSRSWANWQYASSRTFVSPFAWIDGDLAREGRWTAPRPASYVARQLSEYRKWGMDELAIFQYARMGAAGGGLGFDYTPYKPALQDTTMPLLGTPSVTILSPTTGSRFTTSSPAVTLWGVAADPLAIRAIRWSDDHGNRGVAQMTWQITGGTVDTGLQWQMRWTTTVPVPAGGAAFTITAENTKGAMTAVTLTVAPPHPRAPERVQQDRR